MSERITKEILIKYQKKTNNKQLSELFLESEETKKFYRDIKISLTIPSALWNQPMTI